MRGSIWERVAESEKYGGNSIDVGMGILSMFKHFIANNGFLDVLESHLPSSSATVSLILKIILYPLHQIYFLSRRG
jgi:hypothetical protein